MTYTVSFSPTREPILEQSIIEKQSALFKERDKSDEVHIKTFGRNMRSKPFLQNVTFIICDRMIERRHRKKLTVIVLHTPESLIRGVAVLTDRGFRFARPAAELLDAILRADKEYSRIGGDILYGFPLYMSPHFVSELGEKLRAL